MEERFNFIKESEQVSDSFVIDYPYYPYDSSCFFRGLFSTSLKKQTTRTGSTGCSLNSMNEQKMPLIESAQTIRAVWVNFAKDGVPC